MIKHLWMAGLAALFAGTTAQAQETIKIGVNEPLTGAEPGAQVVLEVSGPDASVALATLGDLLEAVADDGDGDAGPPPKG